MIRSPSRTPTRALVAATILAISVAASLATYSIVLARGERQLARSADEHLRLLSGTLDVTINRFRPLAGLVGRSAEIQTLFAEPSGERIQTANALLAWANASVEAEAIYVMNRDGLTVASSNHAEPTSYVGNNYGFRPYFKQALAEGSGWFYGIGVTTKKPGIFLSSAIEVAGTAHGVAVAKINLDSLGANWSMAGVEFAVSDADGIVFLASNPDWRYRPMEPLSRQTIERIDAERRYHEHPIGEPIAEDLARRGDELRRFPLRTAFPDWTITVFASMRPLREQARIAAALALTFCVALALGFVTWRLRTRAIRAERVAKRDLERGVEERTQQLRLARDDLASEIAERRRIDAELNRVRDDLIQAGKLAAVGRAFAGLAHEINQPLAALRTYLASTRLMIRQGGTEPALANIEVMNRTLDRVAVLTDQLKRLARKSEPAREEVALATVVERVLELLKFRIADAGAQLDLGDLKPVAVLGDGARLEQVVMNLVLNAIDAVEGRDDRSIAIALREEGDTAELVVADSGAGISPEDRQHLFEPFFTTKGVGQGLGIGLAISYAIIQEHGGSVAYEARDRGGACFRVRLTLAAGTQARETGGS